MAIMIGGALSVEMDGYSMSITTGDVLNVKSTSTTVPDASMEIDALNVNQDGSHQSMKIAVSNQSTTVLYHLLTTTPMERTTFVKIV